MSTENNQRDELARELFIADNGNQSREQSIVDWKWFEGTDNYRGRLEHYKNMAAGMIAAGYRKPRGIITADEIENMQGGSVIIGPDWHSEVYAYTGMSLWYSPGSNVPWDARELEARGPFIVLHEPEDEATQ